MDAFLEHHKKFIRIDPVSHKVFFTKAGKTEFSALFARYGYALDSIRTVEHFAQVLRECNEREYHRNTEELSALYETGELNGEEKALLERLLGFKARSDTARIAGAARATSTGRILRLVQ